MTYPKIELHCHLDGSLRPQTVLEFGVKMNRLSRTATLNQIESQLSVDLDCDSLSTYLEKFDLPIAIMQTEEVIERVAFELFEDAFHDGVKYLEVRFAPHLHTREGLSLECIIECVLKGMNRATQQYTIYGNLILSHLRHHDQQMLYDLIDAGRPFLNRGVVAVDLCGNEELHFARKFVDAIHYAREVGYQITIHAGETGFYENIEDAIVLLKARRIGHGVAMKNHPGTLELVREHGVLVELCPTSNMNTKAITDLSSHPIDYFYKNHLQVNINTDNRTVSKCTLSSEYELVSEVFNWNECEFKEVYQMALNASFCNEEIKSKLLGLLK